MNGVKCNIASRRINVGDVISLGDKAKEMALVIEAQSLPERDIPEFLSAMTARRRVRLRDGARRWALLRDLEHPNIVPIYDVGMNGDGALFYSMKRVKGTPWMDVIGDKTAEENIGILLVDV